jgi:hypothetical protein
MKRKVTITLTFDPTEYEQGEDTPTGAIDLAIDMIAGDTDFPDGVDQVVIESDQVVKIQGHHF